MKRRIIQGIVYSGALAIPLLTLDLQAQPTVGWRGANNPSSLYWNVPGNWSLNRVPSCVGTNILGDKASFNSGPQPACFINSLALPSQFVVGDGNPGFVYILNGGSLVSSNFSGAGSWNAIGYNSMARLEMSQGATLISSNNLWVGYLTNSRAQFVMNGGTATVQGAFGAGGNGGIGTIQVNGGTLNLWQWNDTASLSAFSQLDIRNGSVIISNDHTASINAYIAGGQITGFGGVGTVTCSLVTDNVSNTNTVLTATCPPGAGGPYPVTNGSTFIVETTFPTNINPNLMVHYWALDPPAAAPGPNWTPCLDLINSGDASVADVTLRGLSGKQASTTTSSANFNLRDTQYQAWNTNGLIDILLCVFGDAGIMRSNALDVTQPKRLLFEEGALPVNVKYYGGFLSTNIYNNEWNWVLFTITNNFQSNMVDRVLGSLPTNVSGSYTYGGINGGTLRIATSTGNDATVKGISIRAAAIGQHGAFGTAPDINQFVLPNGACPPVLDKNLVSIDFGVQTNNLVVINDANSGQTVEMVNNLGPAGDQRTAVRPTGMFLNFGILNDYLGKPCNDNVVLKVCMDYFDDPAFANAGVMFGPYAYATDSMGDLGYIPFSSLPYLQGTGKWIRRSWTFPSVNLKGVSTDPLTGGVQFISINGQVAVSRCSIAVIRSGGPLAGQDPLADCLVDMNVCQGVYGNSAEWNQGTPNGIDLGDNGGDQGYVTEVAGPANDQRQSVSPTNAPSYYLNFRLVNDLLGPATQGNVHLAMVVTYYDDPALKGTGFRPDVWQALQIDGTTNTVHMSSARNMVVQGTGQWRDAYWEIGAIAFFGVNQTPPAAARFACGGPIHISRVRYATVRGCGLNAGQNPLRGSPTLVATPDTNNLMRLSWPYRAPQSFLQSATALGGSWSTFSGTPVVEGGEQSVLRFGPTNAARQFFRLSLTPQ